MVQNLIYQRHPPPPTEWLQEKYQYGAPGPRGWCTFDLEPLQMCLSLPTCCLPERTWPTLVSLDQAQCCLFGLVVLLSFALLRDSFLTYITVTAYLSVLV